jgi:hypothetical protein
MRFHPTPVLRATLFALALPLTATPVASGGFLETRDITGRVPAPGGGVLSLVVPIRWDERCIPVPMRVNDVLDPIPNPLGIPFLSLEDVETALDRAVQTWNGVPTSFFRLERTGRVSNPGLRRFDFVNEVTFHSSAFFTGFARSLPTVLPEDTTLTHGQDVDGDGDPDVIAGLDRCRDADGDGDHELPAGSYRAGTILDFDIEINTGPDGFRFTLAAADADVDPRSLDLQALLTHELGHLHGLAHTLTNQLSDHDGRSATLFQVIDTLDPEDELAFRTLTQEDVAASSFHYPEGSRSGGPGALQPGDLPFHALFGVLHGEAVHGPTGVPLAGGSVFAEHFLTGERLSTAITGTVRQVVDLVTERPRRVSADFDILDGRFLLPVPLGLVRIGIEAVDGDPLFASAINETAREGSVSGQADFVEEFWNGSQESDREDDLDRAQPVVVLPFGLGFRSIDFVTDRTASLAPFGPQNISVFQAAPPGTYYAVRFTPEELEAMLRGDTQLLAARFHTQPFDSSTVPRFEEALLTTGRVQLDGRARLDLDRPLERQAPFIGQDDDFANLFFRSPRSLTREVERLLRRGSFEGLFLVLRVPRTQPFPGISRRPPLIASDRAAPGEPPRGRSFLSTDGRDFLPVVQDDFRFELVVSAGEDP